MRPNLKPRNECFSRQPVLILRKISSSLGNTLLTGDSSGLCCVWEMVNSMSNNWKVQRKFHLEGEEILSIGWFHHGVRVRFD